MKVQEYNFKLIILNNTLINPSSNFDDIFPTVVDVDKDADVAK